MSESIKTDDVIFNFFKQICDEKDDQKCLELGKNWVIAMETNLASLESNFCLLYTSPSPRDATLSRMPSSA